MARTEVQFHTIAFSSLGIPLIYWKHLFRQNQIIGFYRTNTKPQHELL